MTKEQVKEELSKQSDGTQQGFHMMATVAHHQTGNISSDTPDICFVYADTDKFYIGNWVFGFGYFNVLFPKETTRELTPEEVAKYDGSGVAINDTRIADLKVKTKSK